MNSSLENSSVILHTISVYSSPANKVVGMRFQHNLHFSRFSGIVEGDDASRK
jgi:hypothetical protein